MRRQGGHEALIGRYVETATGMSRCAFCRTAIAPTRLRRVVNGKATSKRRATTT